MINSIDAKLIRIVLLFNTIFLIIDNTQPIKMSSLDSNNGNGRRSKIEEDLLQTIMVLRNSRNTPLSSLEQIQEHPKQTQTTQPKVKRRTRTTQRLSQQKDRVLKVHKEHKQEILNRDQSGSKHSFCARTSTDKNHKQSKRKTYPTANDQMSKRPKSAKRKLHGIEKQEEANSETKHRKPKEQKEQRLCAARRSQLKLNIFKEVMRANHPMR